MKHTSSLNTLFSALLVALAVPCLLTDTAKADTNLTSRIDNPGFESRFDGWNDIEPSGISRIERSGSRSGKITGSSGKIKQFVNISSNRDYELSAYIRGNGKLRAKVNGVNFSNTRGNSTSYRKVTVSFNSGSATRFEIWCEYNGQTCRFDDIQLFEITGSSGGSGELFVQNVTSSDNDGNEPFNVIDGDLNSRWSARGSGQHITLDLGQSRTIGSADIAFFRGNERSAFFDILVGTRTSNLTRVYSGTSSGSTRNPESFNFSDRTGRYVRIVGFGNTSNIWNSITEFSVFGADGTSETQAPAPTPTQPSGGDTANEIIGRGWKLNGFSGSLRVGNNDNGLDYADDASTSESHFFFERNGYAAFRCYPGSPTSGGSSNPRSELREEIGGGDGFWNGDTSTERSMKWRFRIEDLPPSGKLCFGQIHERDDRFDDIIRVQVEGSAGQNSGSVKLRILGYVTEELLGSGQTAGNINMDTEYYYELTMRNGVVRLYELNNSGNRVDTLFTSRDVGNADQNYFKAGCYLQSTQSSHSGSSVYGQVLIKDLTLRIDD